MSPGPTVLSYGGGVNSTALLIGLLERGEPLDLALWADTGGEWDETYSYIEEVTLWAKDRGVDLIRVSNAARVGFPHASLENECINNSTLPSLAFGFRGCSHKWKVQPMDRFLKAWEPAKAAWAEGEKVTRLIGIDADESHRSQALCDEIHARWIYRRPLVEWDWGREECFEAIKRAGLPEPRKSACWFCPAMRKKEVLSLSRDRPDLFKRAVEMENNARDSGGLKSVRGLGRNYSWEELVKADKAQGKLFPETVEISCGCFDGEE